MARLAKSSISAARSKVGYAPLQALHERACVPLASARKPPHAFNAGLRLVAVDGSNFDVPDEAANAIAFGYPGSRTGHAAYPQAQCAALIECVTPVRASDLLWHCGGVVTCDQPLLAVPLVGVCVASLDLRPSRAKRECVEPGVDRGRTTNLYCS